MAAFLSHFLPASDGFLPGSADILPDLCPLVPDFFPVLPASEGSGVLGGEIKSLPQEVAKWGGWPSSRILVCELVRFSWRVTGPRWCQRYARGQDFWNSGCVRYSFVVLSLP
jgi:hypothetical protein